MAKIGIIGAGIGGLATANLLAQDGHEVHVYEQAAIPGGRAGQFTSEGFTFDTGPSWYLMPEVFERYYQRVGTSTKEQLTLKQLTPAYKVFYEKGEPLTITGDLSKDAVQFEAREAGAGDALKTYVESSDQLYQNAMRHFLYSNFTKPTALLHKDIVSRSKHLLDVAFTPLHSYVRRFIKNPQLQQVLEYPAVFLGTSPYKAPALYSLMSALDFKEGVYYPQGTMYSVVESLVRIGKKHGVHYHFNSPVKRIKTQHGSAEGFTLQDGTPIECDVVVSNADLHHTETVLLGPGDQSYPTRYWNKKEASPSALLIFLGIKGAVEEFEHHTLLFVDDWRKNFTDIYENTKVPTPASLYISKTSQSDTTAPKGHENIFVLVPLPAGMYFSAEESEQLADRYLEQIKAMTGVDLKSRTVTKKVFGPQDFKADYNSWQGSMLGPSHKLTQSAFFRTPNKSKKVKSLYYVGAGTVPGVGVPMCLISAELVYERIKENL